MQITEPPRRILDFRLSDPGKTSHPYRQRIYREVSAPQVIRKIGRPEVGEIYLRSLPGITRSAHDAGRASRLVQNKERRAQPIRKLPSQRERSRRHGEVEVVHASAEQRITHSTADHPGGAVWTERPSQGLERRPPSGAEGVEPNARDARHTRPRSAAALSWKILR